jgi:DnaK suppressor protein
MGDRAPHPRPAAQTDLQIEAALRRIDNGEYGYCEVTGEPISLARLEARPIATMTVEAQERHERQERVSRDD